MTHPKNPSIKYADVFQFEGDVPFSWSSTKKYAAPIQSVGVINLDNFKPDHEVMAFEIYFDGPFTNPKPIPVSITFTRQSDNKVVYQSSMWLPTPQSKGWEWWNWYRFKAWIGKASHEINGPGDYKVRVQMLGADGWTYDKTIIKTVTGAPAEGPRLRVITSPSGATVKVAGIHSEISPTPFMDLTKGVKYELTVRKEDYVTIIDQITALEDKDYTESYELTPVEKPPPPLPPEERPPLWNLVQLIYGADAEAVWQMWKDFIDPIQGFINLFVMEIPGPVIDGKQYAGIPIFFLAGTEIEVITKALPAGIRAAIKGGGEKVALKAAGEISEWGTRDFAGLGKWIEGLSRIEREKLFTGLSMYGRAAGDRATDTLIKSQLSIAEKAGFTGITKTLKKIALPVIFVGGIISFKEALSWFHKELPEILSFPLRDLIRDGKWEEAEKLLPAYRQLVATSANFLRATGFEALLGLPIWQGYADGYEEQLHNWEREIFDGLEGKAKELKSTIRFIVEPEDAIIRIVGWDNIFHHGDIVEWPPGNYVAIAEKEGYIPAKSKFFPEADMEKPVTLVLQKIPSEIEAGAGRLQLLIYDDKTGAPITATLMIDGRVEPFTLHSYVLDLREGAYEIRLEKPKYDFYEDTISISEGEITPVVVRLKTVPPLELPPLPEVPEEIEEEVPAKGTLEVSSDPVASVHIAGVEVLSKTPGRIELLPGIVDVTFKAEGYLNKTKTAYINAGEVYRIAVTLWPTEKPLPKRKLAKVTVNSNVIGAKILVNGTVTGKYVPDYIILESGEYEICLAKSGYKTKCVPLKLVEE